MFAEDGDGYPFFVADSVMLFSSRRKGGFGGKDLYMTTYSNGVWAVPQNLGPEINSVYDEISPFLSKDGRTLYFSSNNSRSSLGGLDIFKSRFDDASLQWSAPENLGVPINSSEDDLHFRLTKDGLKAYFSTSRKDGIGMRDIYVAYFKSARNEQIYTSIPEHFAEVLAYSKPSNPYAPTTSISSEIEILSPSTGGAPAPNQEVENYEFQPIYYSDDDDILNSRNIKKLNNVALLLKKYPQLKAVLACNSSGFDGPVQFDLYFAVKRAEVAANYLIENGVSAESIRVKGLGSMYPLAKAITEQGDNPLAKRYNNRIDFYIGNTYGLPVEVKDIELNVGTFVDDRGSFYLKMLKGLSYKVQMASLKQMYNSSIFTSYRDPMVERNTANPYYQYTVGLYKTYSSAEQLMQDLKKQGITEAFIVPYIDGQRISPEEAQSLSNIYSDLSNYLRRIGE